MREIVFLSDSRIAEVPVKECAEPLVDLRTLEAVRVDPRLADEASAYAHVRQSVADRLVVAQTRLPRELRFLIIEGFRPAALQRRYFASAVTRQRAAHPDWDDARARIEASRYVSPPEVAPHSTGGAVDLTLRTSGGVELDMGTAVNATPPESDENCYTDAPDISPEARSNRRIMGDALISAGFVNYRTEWWHWSFGERYWAFITQARYARYGIVEDLTADIERT
ncbi:M15 family metallopeptidase [Nonomuraea sp. NPDC048882]|uniref:M15 family metallopeptidase n=1 Tax=Nonomuraea sp. NPDC048882 TaxID=3154347 RepID=UPI0033C62867